jgi:hypothetical protein
MYTGFDFGKTEIFLQTGLDMSKFSKPSDLPVGQNYSPDGADVSLHEAEVSTGAIDL